MIKLVAETGIIGQDIICSIRREDTSKEMSVLLEFDEVLKANTLMQREVEKLENRMLTDETIFKKEGTALYFDQLGRLEADGETLKPRLMDPALGDAQYAYLASVSGELQRQLVIPMPEEFTWKDEATVIFFLKLTNPKDNLIVYQATSDNYYKYKEYPEHYGNMALSLLDDYQVSLRNIYAKPLDVYVNANLILQQSIKLSGNYNYMVEYTDGSKVEEEERSDLCIAVDASSEDTIPHEMHFYGVKIINRVLTQAEVEKEVIEGAKRYGY